MINIVGKRIIGVRKLNKEELHSEDWDEESDVVAVVLDDESIIYAGMDEEGTCPGEIFFRQKNGIIDMICGEENDGDQDPKVD